MCLAEWIHSSFLILTIRIRQVDIQRQDHICYYLYKFSEACVTKGIWYSKESQKDSILPD
jgi:hypothetical protein